MHGHRLLMAETFIDPGRFAGTCGRGTPSTYTSARAGVRPRPRMHDLPYLRPHAELALQETRHRQRLESFARPSADGAATAGRRQGEAGRRCLGPLGPPAGGGAGRRRGAAACRASGAGAGDQARGGGSADHGRRVEAGRARAAQRRPPGPPGRQAAARSDGGAARGPCPGADADRIGHRFGGRCAGAGESPGGAGPRLAGARRALAGAGPVHRILRAARAPECRDARAWRSAAAVAALDRRRDAGTGRIAARLRSRRRPRHRQRWGQRLRLAQRDRPSAARCPPRRAGHRGARPSAAGGAANCSARRSSPGVARRAGAPRRRACACLCAGGRSGRCRESRSR